MNCDDFRESFEWLRLKSGDFRSFNGVTKAIWCLWSISLSMWSKSSSLIWWISFGMCSLCKRNVKLFNYIEIFSEQILNAKCKYIFASTKCPSEPRHCHFEVFPLQWICLLKIDHSQLATYLNLKFHNWLLSLKCENVAHIEWTKENNNHMHPVQN